PYVNRWVIRLKSAEGLHHSGVLALSPTDVNTAAINARRHGTACRRHLRARWTPLVLRRVVFLDYVNITASRRNERSPDASTNDVDLAINHPGDCVVACGWHRRSGAPTVRCRIIFFDRIYGMVRTLRVEEHFTQIGHGAANNIDLVPHCSCYGRPALGWHWGQCLPSVGRWVVLPRVVYRLPRGRARLGHYKATERVDLALELDNANMVRGQRHRVSLRPFVRCGIVLIDQCLGFPSRRKTCKHKQLPSRGSAEQLLRRFRERRFPQPFALLRVGRFGQQECDYQDKQADQPD